MSDLQSQEVLVRDHFDTNWTTAYPNTPIYAENQRVPVPDVAGVSTQAQLEASCWARIYVSWGASQQADLHGITPRIRTAGSVVVHLFSPAGFGTGTLMSFADTVVSMFRRLRLGGMLFRTPTVTKVGDVGDGWFQINVSAPMHYDEIDS